MKRILTATLVLLTALQVTASAGVVVIGNLARTHKIRPGDPFEGVIMVRNTESRPADVRIYQTDYRCFASGENRYDEPGTTPRSNANWITLSPTRLHLDPGQTVPVHFKGRAPTEAALRGTFWSMVMVEPSLPPAPVAHGKDGEVAMGLQTLIRFGVQLVTEVGRDAQAKLVVCQKQLVTKDGKRLLEIDLENKGERLVIPTASVELFNAQGISIGKFDGTRTRIYPGCSARMGVNLSDVPPGKYNAMVLFDGGDDEVMGAQYELEITAS